MNMQKILDNIRVDENGCWNWRLSTNSAGYGQLTLNKKHWLAHRYSLTVYLSRLPFGVVRHMCHNKLCCNPVHLMEGSHQDNYNDSLSVHTAAAKKKRKVWIVDGEQYETCRDVVIGTGISINSIIKYTINGEFDIGSYREACFIANKIPKI